MKNINKYFLCILALLLIGGLIFFGINFQKKATNESFFQQKKRNSESWKREYQKIKDCNIFELDNKLKEQIRTEEEKRKQLIIKIKNYKKRLNEIDTKWEEEYNKYSKMLEQISQGKVLDKWDNLNNLSQVTGTYTDFMKSGRSIIKKAKKDEAYYQDGKVKPDLKKIAEDLEGEIRRDIGRKEFRIKTQRDIELKILSLEQYYINKHIESLREQLSKIGKESILSKKLLNSIYFDESGNNVIVDLSKMKLYLEAGANPNWLPEEYGGKISVFRILVGRANMAEADQHPESVTAVKLMLDYGAKLGKNDGGILYSPISSGNYEVVKMLLENGANAVLFPEGANIGSNITPIELASENGHRDIVELLVKHGAIKPDKKIIKQIKFIDRALDGTLKELENSFVKGVDINGENNQGNTALVNACSYFRVGENEYNKIKYLIRHGADVNKTAIPGLMGHERISPLNQCIVSTSITLKSKNQGSYYAKKLLELLIKSGVLVNEKDVKGRTSLHVAAIKDNLLAAKLLIKNKANINMRDRAKKTPIDYAKSDKMKALLVKYGAKESTYIPLSEKALFIYSFLEAQKYYEDSSSIIGLEKAPIMKNQTYSHAEAMDTYAFERLEKMKRYYSKMLAEIRPYANSKNEEIKMIAKTIINDFERLLEINKRAQLTTYNNHRDIFMPDRISYGEYLEQVKSVWGKHSSSNMKYDEMLSNLIFDKNGGYLIELTTAERDGLLKEIKELKNKHGYKMIFPFLSQLLESKHGFLDQ